MSEKIHKANAIAVALVEYAFRGSQRPEDHATIIAKAKLAARALLELQGMSNVSDKDVSLVLAGL